MFILKLNLHWSSEWHYIHRKTSPRYRELKSKSQFHKYHEFNNPSQNYWVNYRYYTTDEKESSEILSSHGKSFFLLLDLQVDSISWRNTKIYSRALFRFFKTNYITISPSPEKCERTHEKILSSWKFSPPTMTVVLKVLVYVVSRRSKRRI